MGSLPAASNRATYNQDFQLYDDEEGEGISLADATITLEIRKPGCSSAELTATNDDGIEIVDEGEGQFELAFTVAQMRTLCPMTYECGITITQNDETVQYFIGTLPVLDGIVS
jgi:hypothetical protein